MKEQCTTKLTTAIVKIFVHESRGSTTAVEGTCRVPHVRLCHLCAQREQTPRVNIEKMVKYNLPKY
jgi:hypothetical protein